MNNDLPSKTRGFCGRTRREFLWQTGAGFSGAALASMLNQDGFLEAQENRADGTPWENPLKARKPHYPKQKKLRRRAYGMCVSRRTSYVGRTAVSLNILQCVDSPVSP